MAGRVSREKAKVYSYVRVSTAMQVDGFSLDAQRMAIQNYADYEGMEIVREYADEGFSGKNIAGREQFQQMMADIESNRDGVTFVLVFKLSRFGRNAADTLFSLQTMQDYGVNLISVEDRIDSSQETGKLLISIMSSVAEMERDNIHVQTMAGRKQKARTGGWNGGFAPYGYKLVNGKLEIEPEEAKVIEQIFKLFVETPYGANGVAKKLNDEGVKKVMRQNGTLDTFTGHFVKIVLDNPVYMGKIAFGRRKTTKIEGKRNEYRILKEKDPSQIIVSEGKHDAIVSEELWRLAEAKRAETGWKHEKADKDHEYVLSALLRCPMCGSTMYGVCSRSKKRKDGTLYPPYYSYTCRQLKQTTGRDCPRRKQYSATRLENEVAEIICSLVSVDEFAETVRELVSKEVDVNELRNRVETLKKTLRQLEGRQRTIEKQIDTLDYDSPVVDKMAESLNRRLTDTFEDIAECEYSIVETEKRILNVQREKAAQDGVYKVLSMFDAVYDELTDIEKKGLMQALIDHIEIYPEKQKDGHFIKTIHFNFPINYKGEEIWSFSPPNQTTDETVALLSRQKVTEHIYIDVNIADLPKTTRTTATYPEIKAYIKDKYGLCVSSLNIAQIKEKHGFEKRENYNKGKDGHRVPKCPPEKEKAIEDAFKHFGML